MRLAKPSPRSCHRILATDNRITASRTSRCLPIFAVKHAMPERSAPFLEAEGLLPVSPRVDA